MLMTSNLYGPVHNYSKTISQAHFTSAGKVGREGGGGGGRPNFAHALDMLNTLIQ